MRKKPKSGGSKPHPNPYKNEGYEQKRDVSGDIPVRGEVEAKIPVEVTQEQNAFEEAKNSRDKIRLAVEIAGLAIVAIYAGLTYWQAQSAATQATIARRNQAVLEAQLAPFIVMTHMDLAEPLVPGKPIRILNDFINTGGSPAFDVQNLQHFQIVPPGQPPAFDVHEVSGSRATIGSKETFDSPLFLPARTQEQVDWIRRGLAKVYVVGKVLYTDTSGKVHHLQYCRLLDPTTGGFNGCKIPEQND